jgi:hypothetical protein
MTRFGDLRARARAASSSAAAGEIEFEASSVHQDVVIEAIATYFGEDDTRQEVRIVIAGDALGYLTRKDAQALIRLKPKGIGSAFDGPHELSQSGLPGNRTTREEESAFGDAHELSQSGLPGNTVGRDENP